MGSLVQTIAVVSDLHTGKDRKGRERFDHELGDLVVERINELNPDLTIVPGDVTANGTPDQFEQASRFLERINDPKVIVCGQQDRNEHYPNCFENFFGELPAYHEFDDVAIFALDSTDSTKHKIKKEIADLELKTKNGVKLTRAEREKVGQEIEQTIQSYELVKDPTQDDFVRYNSYYSNLMQIYLRRIKRLKAILNSDIDHGFVGRPQRKWLTEALKEKHLPITIVVTHYSPISRDYADNELFDGGNILRTCLEEDVTLLVVGDRHTSDVVTYNRGGRHHSPLLVFQAGSATNMQFDPNQYGVIEIDRGKGTINLYSTEVRTGELARNRFSGNPYYPVRLSLRISDN